MCWQGLRSSGRDVTEDVADRSYSGITAFMLEMTQLIRVRGRGKQEGNYTHLQGKQREK